MVGHLDLLALLERMAPVAPAVSLAPVELMESRVSLDLPELLERKAQVERAVLPAPLVFPGPRVSSVLLVSLVFPAQEATVVFQAVPAVLVSLVEWAQLDRLELVDLLVTLAVLV